MRVFGRGLDVVENGCGARLWCEAWELDFDDLPAGGLDFLSYTPPSVELTMPVRTILLLQVKPINDERVEVSTTKRRNRSMWWSE